MTTLTIAELNAGHEYNYRQFTSERIKFGLCPSKFKGCKFSECAFEDLDFSYTTFSDCTFSECMFVGVKFSNCKFSECTFIECGLSATKLNDCIVSLTKLYACNLVRCSLCHSSFSTDSTLEKCTFFECDFRNTGIAHVSIEGCKFSKTIVGNGHSIVALTLGCYSITMTQNSISIGCSTMTVDKWVARREYYEYNTAYAAKYSGAIQALYDAHFSSSVES